MLKNKLSMLLLLTIVSAFSQAPVPDVLTGLGRDTEGVLQFNHEGTEYSVAEYETRYPMEDLFGHPKGTDEGVELDFGTFRGTMYYGLIPYGKSRHPQTVYRMTEKLSGNIIQINIAEDFRYPYDFVDWKEKGHLTIGYRLVNARGQMIYDGEITLTGTSPFTIVPSIYEGPFIANVLPDGFSVWFHTTDTVGCTLEIDGLTLTETAERTFAGTPSTVPGQFHRFDISGLKPDTDYSYTVHYGSLSQIYSTRTAPKKGSRAPFVFAYTSDSREAVGGGERSMYGTNAYIMKKMTAMAYSEGAAFMQFTGDMINGYLSDVNDQQLQYTNWKKSLELFWHYLPVYTGMGNHESFGYKFPDKEGNWMAFADGFPYETMSSEKLYGDAFVNPENGPASEDGASYDPNPDRPGDFPPYLENVYYYTWANIAMIVLNSDYWYSPTLWRRSEISGNLHGYIMDRQLEWLEETLLMFERDRKIDHVFVTQHTPAFPNGGHSRDDMWYSGDNSKRAYVAGKPLDKGIIERRDELLDLLINRSGKVVALLTGDEHNYNRLKITADVNIYPDGWPYEKLKIGRPFHQINNGAAGAPYYGQERLPWSEHTRAFSVENALCLFYVDGKKITMKVYNPDTLDKLDEIRLK